MLRSAGRGAWTAAWGAQPAFLPLPSIGNAESRCVGRARFSTRARERSRPGAAFAQSSIEAGNRQHARQYAVLSGAGGCVQQPAEAPLGTLRSHSRISLRTQVPAAPRQRRPSETPPDLGVLSCGTAPRADAARREMPDPRSGQRGLKFFAVFRPLARAFSARLPRRLARVAQTAQCVGSARRLSRFDGVVRAGPWPWRTVAAGLAPLPAEEIPQHTL